MAKLAATTYADALFELALEEGKIEEIAQDMQDLAEAFTKNQGLAKLMAHPKVSKEEKVQVMKEILQGRVTKEVEGFIQLLIAKERYVYVESIFEYFIARVKEYNNIGIAYVTTAVELNDIQKQQIEKRLLQTTRYKAIEIQYAIDAKLIGGMIIRIGDRVVDSSIQTKLNELTKELTKIQLAI